jgi:hypothetical protein
VRRYAIDFAGVRAFNDKAKLLSIDGLEGDYRGVDVLEFETSIPASALPRVGTAPLRKMVVQVEGVTTSREARSSVRSELKLPEPVDFPPWEAERRFLFQYLESSRDAWLPLPLAYDPADASNVYVHQHPNVLTPSSLEQYHGPLFTPIGKLGRVELLHAMPRLETILVVVDGKPETTLQAHRGVQVLHRAGELHVLSVWEYYEYSTGHDMVTWFFYRIAPDGTVMASENYQDHRPRWRTVSGFHDPTYTRIGIRGMGVDENGRTYPKTIEWRYEPNEKAYMLQP